MATRPGGIRKLLCNKILCMREILLSVLCSDCGSFVSLKPYFKLSREYLCVLCVHVCVCV